MDNLVFEESINTEISSSEFVDKQWLYVNDNNNSNYSGQVVIDTTSLSNSGSYINWSEAFLAIPLVLQAYGTGIGANTDLDYLLGMKNGFWQIIHSLTCEFNNGNIIQQTAFLNVFCSFKNLTSWSKDDVKDWGAICGFCPDTASSWLFNQSANSATNILGQFGTGLCNNSIVAPVQIDIAPIATPAAAATLQLYGYNLSTLATQSSDSVLNCVNSGLQQRMAWLNYKVEVSNGSSLNNLSTNKSILLSNSTTTSASATGYSQVFQSYVLEVANSRAIVFDAVVRLKDIADFFQKCPLLKGSTMRIYINTNQVQFNAQLTSPIQSATTGAITSAGGLTLTSNPVILGGGGTNPVMLGSVAYGQGASNLVPPAAAQTTQNISVALSIVRTAFTNQFSSTYQYAAPITSVRLYAPAYTMSPIAEQRYLSLTPTKKVVYNDIFQYTFPVNSSGPFSFLVTNGIPNIRGVLCIPLLNQAQNGGAAGAGNYANGVNVSTLFSPFCSTGSSPDPISITNFNIQVSGRNLFINNFQYNYEMFYNQLVSSNQLNGSLTTSLASGQIGYDDFNSLYRFYYGNASRSIPSEDGVAKAIQVVGTNNTTLPFTFLVFVEFEREITIDVRTGARIQ